MAIWNRKKDEEEEKLPKSEQPKQEEKTPAPAPTPAPTPDPDPQKVEAAAPAKTPEETAADAKIKTLSAAEKAQAQGFRRTQMEYAKTVDTTLEKAGELNLPENMERHRKVLEKNNEAGMMGNGTTFGYTVNRIGVDVSSIKDERQLAYFASTLHSDKDKRAVMSAWAEENGLSANDVIFHGEEMLGDKLFSEPQTAQGGLNKIGLVDLNGEALDLRTADFASVVNAAQSIPDKTIRKQAFEHIEKMTKTYGGRFFGQSLDGVSTDFRDSIDFSQADYDDFVDGLGNQFYAADGHEEENLRRYMAQYEAINGESSLLSGAQKRWYTKALEDAFVQQMGYGSMAPDVQKARAVLDQLDAARAAQAMMPEESGEDDEPGLIRSALNAVKEFAAGILGGKDKQKEASPAGAVATPTLDPVLEGTPSPMSRMKAEDLPMTLVASASPAPVTAGRAAFRKDDEDTEEQQEAPEVQGPVYEPQDGAQTAPTAGAVNLTGDMATALEYAHTGRIDELDEATQEMLRGFEAKGGAGRRALLRVVTPEFYQKVQAGNEGADYLWLEEMGNQLGSQLGSYALRIYDPSFPRELYGDAVMAIDEIISAAEREPLTKAELEASGGNRIVAYLAKHQDALSGVDAVFHEIDGIREDGEAYAAEVAAEADAELERARQAVAIGQASAAQRQLVLENAPQMDNVMAMRDPTYADMYQQVSDYFYDAAGNWGEDSPAWMDGWVYKTMKANGVQDLEDGESEYELLLYGTMDSMLMGDMRMAAAVGQDLETYYKAQGGMSMDMLAQRASAEIIRRGSQTSAEEVAAVQETVAGEADKAGLGMGKTLGLTAKVSSNTVKEGRYESFLMVAAATDIPRDVARITADFNRQYGAFFGPAAYKKVMYAYANSGKLPKELSDHIIGYLDEGGDPYQLGIHPEDNEWAVSGYAQTQERAATYQKMIAAQATEGEAKFIQYGSGVLQNAQLMAETTGLALLLSPFGAAGQYAAIRTVYGSMNQGKAMSDYMSQGYRLAEALTLSQMQVAGEALANVATLGHLTDRLYGYSSLLNKGLTALGGVSNPKVASAFITGVKSFFSEIAEETVKDPLLEGTFSAALVGAAKDAMDGGFNPIRNIVAGVDAAVSSVPETVSAMIDEAPQTIMATIPFALLGAGGEVVRNSASAKAARAYIENPTEENAKAFTGAVMTDAQDGRWIDSVMSEMRKAEIESETAANLMFAPDKQLYEKAQKTREQANSHKQQMEASQTRIDEGWAAYDEGEASGNVDEQLAALETVAKGKQGLEEHTREYEQKSLEAREAERELVQEAHDRAVADVNARHSRQKAEDAAAQEQRQQAETQQRETGNIDALDAEMFIEENYPDASDEQKQTIRERFASQDGKATAEVSSRNAEFASKLSRRFGLSVTFTDSHGEFKGYHQGSEIVLDKNATQGEAIKKIALHELTHHAESSGYYQEFSDALIGLRYGEDTAQFDADVRAVQAMYQQRLGREFAMEDARREVVADLTQEVLYASDGAIEKLVGEKPSLARRIAEVLKDFVNKLRGVNDPELERIRRTQRLFEKALDTANSEQRMVKFALDSYGLSMLSDESVQNIKSRNNEVAENRADLDAHVERALSSTEQKTVYIGGITEETKKSLEEETGVKLFRDLEYAYGVSYDCMRHIRKHFKTADEIGTAIETLFSIVNDHDEVEPVKRKDGGYNLRFKKDYSTVEFEAIAETSKRTRSLTMKTAYLSRVHEKGATINQADTSNSKGAPRLDDVSDSIISENASVDNRKYSLPSTDLLDRQIAQYRSIQTTRDTGERQFATQTAQRSAAVPKWLKQELMANPEQRYYDRETNDDQLIRAWNHIQQEGYEAARDRLLKTENFTTDDNAEANVIMAMAFREEDVDTALLMAHRYNMEGTKQGQALQVRKLFSRMTPTGIRQWAAGKAETNLAEHMHTHSAQRKQIDAAAQKVADDIHDLQGGDELKRLDAAGDFTIDSSNNRWGVLINEKQRELIDKYGLNKVARPGLFYNRATTKQRMLEAILATPDPEALTGNGLNLIQRLEYLKAGEAVITNADLNYIGQQLAMYTTYDADMQKGREGDLALSRAYEAYGNITPASKEEKGRVWRYVSMLLSIPSAERNIIGNAAQNAVNATTHGLAVELDRMVSFVTGNRTMSHLSLKERAQGWNAFAEETVNTFKDYYTDKTVTSSMRGDDRHNTNQRGRVYQTGWMEAMRLTEGFLMSVGDRNFWKKAYVNSLAEQQRVAKMKGVELDYEEAAEIARAEANYATFNEDSKVRDLMTQIKNHSGSKWSPLIRSIADFLMPFTGVPTNITKRMVEYSPAGLLVTIAQQVADAIMKKDFDQKTFITDLSRGLTGTAMFAIGMMLGNAGLINPGTGEEEDKKLYGLKTARGDQYSPFIQVGSENVSLTTFAPAASPFTMGAVAAAVFKEDENVLNAFINACAAGFDQILNASYFASLAEIFSPYGTFGENLFNSTFSSAVSQNVLSMLSQIATAMDPYVRDTKDTDMIMQALKSGLIQKIPGMREELNEKTDITGKPIKSKKGWRNFFDPFTTTEVVDDPALDELERLYDVTGSSSHIPNYLIPNSGKVTLLKAVADPRGIDRSSGEHNLVLTSDERNKYNKLYSSICFNGGDGVTGIRSLMNDPVYRYYSDEEKADKISDILKKAKIATQKQICEDRGL